MAKKNSLKTKNKRNITKQMRAKNDSFVISYVDFYGEINERTTFQKVAIFIFAGLKFLFDRIVSLIGLIVASPFMILIAIAIKLDSEGPVLFRQKRTGKFGREFYIYKFRTMVANNDVHDFSKADMPTRVGKFLRRTSLDEIPQLFSIVSAKMSFIGPRPWIPDYYDNMNEAQRHRCDVRPGLTGLAQCMGRNKITIKDKINYDLEYIKNYSLIQDIKIVLLTIKAVFTGKGADAGKDNIQREINALKKQNMRMESN
jgi:lipopolysaccharide/colanic/teichoic acid biosynthesis glycosyltransferase